MATCRRFQFSQKISVLVGDGFPKQVVRSTCFLLVQHHLVLVQFLLSCFWWHWQRWPWWGKHSNCIAKQTSRPNSNPNNTSVQCVLFEMLTYIYSFYWFVILKKCQYFQKLWNTILRGVLEININSRNVNSFKKGVFVLSRRGCWKLTRGDTDWLDLIGFPVRGRQRTCDNIDSEKVSFCRQLRTLLFPFPLGKLHDRTGWLTVTHMVAHLCLPPMAWLILDLTFLNAQYVKRPIKGGNLSNMSERFTFPGTRLCGNAS